jgi:cytoskeletal protein RodZ
MKRCPKCDFVYLDSDEVCDLDGTVLVEHKPNIEAVAESSPGENKNSRREWQWLSIVAVAGVALGVILFVVYHVSRRNQQSKQNDSQNIAASRSPTVSLVAPAIESVPPTPEASPSPVARTSASPRATPAARLSSNPVSTTGAEVSSSHGVIIRLTDGGTISADEAWRTRDGIWYRRNGVVTLLKRERVRSIDKAP